MNAIDINAVLQSLIRSGGIEDMVERLILADAMEDAGRTEEVVGLRDATQSHYWLAGKRLCWGEWDEWFLVFSDGKHRYVINANHLEYREFHNKFDEGKQAIRCDSAGMDDTFSDSYWVMAIADCFSPPMAIIRAGNEQDAIEIFCEEFTWAHIDNDELADYVAEEGDDKIWYYSPSGTPCNLDNLHMWQVKLIDAIRIK